MKYSATTAAEAVAPTAAKSVDEARATSRGTVSVVVFTDSDHASCLKTLISHATFHQHYAWSYRPVRSGELLTWSSLNEQRGGMAVRRRAEDSSHYYSNIVGTKDHAIRHS